jgi:hypothetical protein
MYDIFDSHTNDRNWCLLVKYKSLINRCSDLNYDQITIDSVVTTGQCLLVVQLGCTHSASDVKENIYTHMMINQKREFGGTKK